MKTKQVLAASLLLLAGAAGAQAVPNMTLVGRNVGGPANGGAFEISAYDKFTNRLFSTVGGDRLEIFNFGNGRTLTDVGDVDFSSVGTFDSFSSVSIDPLGRGFGVVSAIPEANTTTPGKAIFFNTTTGAILGSVDVGFHPDMITFTPDGTKILVANEGEPALAPLVADGVGSVSVITVNAGSLGSSSVANISLAAMDLTGLRINPANAATPFNDLDPEYVAISADGTKAFVSVQEANAVITIDLTGPNANTITKTNALGTIVQNIDASNTDGGPTDRHPFASIFMPDAIATYSIGGTNYYITANEGDARDAAEFPFMQNDFITLAQANIDGLLDAATAASLDLTPSGVGNLVISKFDGDTDNDGQIEVPHAFGTRSFTIWNADTGAMVFDSGSDFEEITALLVNSIYNSSNSNAGAGNQDSRSDDKGPEPEAVTIGLIEGRFYAYIGLERVGGFFVYDITDPNNPFFVEYENPALVRGLGATRRPEGMIFISAADSPTGEEFIILSHEDRGGIQVYANVIPEPSSALLALCGFAGMLARRARRD